MNKKFLSAILFGALMITSTGTFVSCKDYDDDIEGLQEQIDKLATKEDLSSQIATLQAALNSASSNAADALAKANAAAEAAKAAGDEAAAAKAAAEKAAAEAEAKAIEAAKATVEAAKAELEKLVADGLAENKAELEKMAAIVAEAKAEVESIVGSIADMVTSVELVYSYNRQNANFVYSIPVIKGRFAYSFEDDYTYSGGQYFSYPMNSDYFDFTPIFKNGEEGETIIMEDIMSDGWIEYLNQNYDSFVGEIDYMNVQYSYERGYIGQFLTYRTVFEKENVFGKDLTGEITFTKDAQVQRTVDFIVRVSPTNAVLTKDMISLVNSQGVKNDLIEVVEVKPYTGLLTRGANDNGLWVVTSRLTQYVKDEFNAVASDKNGRSVLFAAAVNNTASTASDRNVISSYDLAMNHTNYVGSRELYFWVDQTPVREINNRFSDASISLENPGNGTVNYYELNWKNGAAVAATNLNSDGSPKENSNTYWDDNRNSKKLFPAVQGKAITIELAANNWSSYANRYAPDVKAMYVTLDKKANAIESAPSEWNAWNKYDYDGLNEVVEGTSTTITINGEETINDVIGFRVYAVNHDGTLVDPDGKAFYVVLGDKANEWAATATTIVPDADDATTPNTQNSDTIAVSLTKLTGATVATWSTDKIGDVQPVFDVNFLDKNYNVLSTNGSGVSTVKWDEVAYITTTPRAGFEWYQYEDGKAYNGTLTIKNEPGHVLASMTISMTKELPTTMPIGYALKDKQVIDGIYNCYMIADNWAATLAKTGEMPIENLIYFGEAQADQYMVYFAESADDANNDGKLETVNAMGNSKVTVKSKYVDNATEHATKVTYNYGMISSAQYAAHKANSYVSADYVVTGDEFKTVYCCFYMPTVHTWNWATREQLAAAYPNANPSWTATTTAGYVRQIPSMELTYGTEFTLPNNGTIDMYIFGTNGIDNTFSAPLASPYESSLTIVEAKLISDATSNEDYFDVQVGENNALTFTVIKEDLGSNPKQNVPSTLEIKCKDSYNHDVVIKMSMVVKPRKDTASAE